MTVARLTIQKLAPARSMASPVAHVLVGWSVCLLCRPREIRTRDALAAAALTVLPDLDLISIAFVGRAGHYWHHTFTHTAAFALLAGLSSCLVSRLRRGETAWRESALIAMLIATHDVVDYYTVDRSIPYGLPLWWPLSVEFHKASHAVFWNIQRGGFWELFGEHNRRAMLHEALVTLPIFAISFWVYHRSRRRSAS